MTRQECELVIKGLRLQASPPSDPIPPPCVSPVAHTPPPLLQRAWLAHASGPYPDSIHMTYGVINIHVDYKSSENHTNRSMLSHDGYHLQSSFDLDDSFVLLCFSCGYVEILYSIALAPLESTQALKTLFRDIPACDRLLKLKEFVAYAD